MRSKFCGAQPRRRPIRHDPPGVPHGRRGRSPSLHRPEVPTEATCASRIARHEVTDNSAALTAPGRSWSPSAVERPDLHFSVGLPGFEPGTFGPPDQRANQAAPQPVHGLSRGRQCRRRPSRGLRALGGGCRLSGRRATRCPASPGSRGRRPAPPASSQRCHGIGGRSSSSSGARCRPRVPGCAAWPASTTRPQDGQVPSTFTVDGERNRSQASHQGTAPIAARHGDRATG